MPDSLPPDLLHSQTLWTYIVVAAFVVAVILAGVQARWINPAKRLERMLREVLNDRKPRSFILEGAPVYGRIAADVERLSVRQRRLTEQVEQEEYNLQAILRSMVEGVIVVDSHHTVQQVNEAFLRQFSLSASPVRRTILEAVRVAAVEEMVAETFRTGEPQSREISVPRPEVDAPPRYFDVNAVPARRSDPRGGQEIQEVVAVFHDISRLKQLEDVRREFVANVSHELRTPLSIFRGYLETLLDNPRMEMPPAELRRILETMRRHSHRLNALVDDLLTLARLEARRVVLERVSLRLAPFLRQIVADVHTQLEGKRIALVLDVPEDLPPADADPFRLEQVVYNLLDNAIKYSEAGGEVTLHARQDGDTIRFQVQDKGTGIPPADLPHIFERFYRVDKARARAREQGREIGGTGLGLSIVKHIVQIHGGEVEAESTLGQGTTITVVLPAAPEEEDGA